MSYLVLARKYRPQTFDEVLGQEHITRTLQNAIKTDRVAHALLFSGPRGVGKTSVARIMAKALNCVEGPTPTPCNVCASCQEITDGHAMDVMEIDGASNRGINEIRELRENVKYMPSLGRFKIYIIDEVHMLTTEAFNALLKTLEEPPAHVLFFFATTEAHKIPITILSRCQRHNFRRIPLSEIVGCLSRICSDLSFTISDASLRILAREASGGLRDALSLLDQVMAYAEKEVGDAEVIESLGVIDQTFLYDLSDAIIRGSVPDAIRIVDLLYAQGHDMKRLYRQMLEHLRHLLMVKMSDKGPVPVDALEDEVAQMKRQTSGVSEAFLNTLFTTWFQSEASIRYSSQPKLVLEVLIVKLSQFQNVESLDGILERLDSISKRLGDDGLPPPTNPTPLSELEDKDHEKQHETGSKKTVEPSATLEQTWTSLLGVFEEKCKTLLPTLEKASLKRIGDDFLELVVEGNSFFCDRLRDKKSKETIEDVCSDFFGRSMVIRVTEKKSARPSHKKRDENEREKRLRKEAMDHPAVTDALDVFNGKIVDVKILE